MEFATCIFVTWLCLLVTHTKNVTKRSFQLRCEMRGVFYTLLVSFLNQISFTSAAKEKRLDYISRFESDRDHFISAKSGCTREISWNSFWLRSGTVIKWPFKRSGGVIEWSVNISRLWFPKSDHTWNVVFIIELQSAYQNSSCFGV